MTGPGEDSGMLGALRTPIALAALAAFSLAAGPSSDCLAAPADRPPPPVPAALAELGGPDPFLAPIARVGGRETPDLLLAQRAIERRFPETPATPPEDAGAYTYVEVEGWKSPLQAAALSAVLPGAGQWYNGSSSRYVFLGVEALAVYSYLHYRDVSRERRAEAVAYAGDPNDPASRWSFARLESGGSEQEATRLREVYAQDPQEFYSLIGSDDRYLAGWQGMSAEPAEVRGGFLAFEEERRDATRKSRFGLFAAVANHVVSMVEALRAARLNNFQIREDLRVKVNAHGGSDPGLSATLIHRFH